MALISNAHPSLVDQMAATSLPVDFVSLLAAEINPALLSCFKLIV